MRGSWGPQTNIFHFECVVLVVEDIHLLYSSGGIAILFETYLLYCFDAKLEHRDSSDLFMGFLFDTE